MILIRFKTPVMRIGIEMSGDLVWLVCSYDNCGNGVLDSLRLFRNESDARVVFEEYIRDLRGDPADAYFNDFRKEIGRALGGWELDDWTVVIYQVKLE